MNATDILLVDDDATTLHLLRGLLEYQGFAVTTSSTGKKALEKLKHKSFAMLITDFHMPGMTGVELTLAGPSGAGLAS